MRPKVPSLSLAVVVLAVAVGGCSLNKKVSEEAKQRAKAEESAKKSSKNPAASSKNAAGDPQQAVIRVEGIYGDRKTSATGVIFEADSGLALTANHAIEAAPAIIATLADGTPLRAQIVARAQCHDLAVLRLSPKPTGARAIPFAPANSVRLAQPVRTISYSLTAAYGGTPTVTSTRGTVSAVNVRETFTPLPAMSPLIAHQSPLAPLASGSPLLNERGQLVGINTLVGHPRKDAVPGVEYALSGDYIRKRLRELKPGPGGTLGGWRSEHDACHHALNQLIAAGHTQGGTTGSSGSVHSTHK